MITFGQRLDDGDPILVVGLDDADLARLATGEPYSFDGGQLASAGLPHMGVILIYGATNADIVDAFRRRGIKVQGRPPGDGT